MKLLSISLGNKGTFDIFGIANVAKQEVKFQGMANGLVFCESDDYEELREIVLEAVSLNESNRNGAN